eukprot:1306373-Rhodomonas_salina.1
MCIRDRDRTNRERESPGEWGNNIGGTREESATTGREWDTEGGKKGRGRGSNEEGGGEEGAASAREHRAW